MEQKRPVEQGTSRLTREQKAARKKERHRRMMVRTITTLVIFFILAGAVILVGTNILRKRRAKQHSQPAVKRSGRRISLPCPTIMTGRLRSCKVWKTMTGIRTSSTRLQDTPPRNPRWKPRT